MTLWHYYLRSYLPMGFTTPTTEDTCATAWGYQSSAWDHEVPQADQVLTTLPADVWRGVYDYQQRRWVQGIWLKEWPGASYGCTPIAGKPGCWRCPSATV